MVQRAVRTTTIMRAPRTTTSLQEREPEVKTPRYPILETPTSLTHPCPGIDSVPVLEEDELYVTLLRPGNPILLLTHLPLRNVPAETVNVHGPLH